MWSVLWLQVLPCPWTMSTDALLSKRMQSKPDNWILLYLLSLMATCPCSLHLHLTDVVVLLSQTGLKTCPTLVSRLFCTYCPFSIAILFSCPWSAQIWLNCHPPALTYNDCAYSFSLKNDEHLLACSILCTYQTQAFIVILHSNHTRYMQPAISCSWVLTYRMWRKSNTKLEQ